MVTVLIPVTQKNHKKLTFLLQFPVLKNWLKLVKNVYFVIPISDTLFQQRVFRFSKINKSQTDPYLTKKKEKKKNIY